ncbi:hypothetical protein M3J09_007729 [Ascochyta lentis]
MAPSNHVTGSAIFHFYDPDIQAKDALGRTQEQILKWDNSHLENSHNYIQMLFPLPESSPFNYRAPVIDLETMNAFRANDQLRQQLRKSFERMLTFYGFTTSMHPEVASEDKDTSEIEKREGTTTVQNAEVSPAASGEDATAYNTTTTTTTEPPAPEAEAANPEPTSQVSPFGYYVVRGPNWRKASHNWCVHFNHNHLRITRILRCLRLLGLQTECDAFFVALKRVYDDPDVSIGNYTMEYWTRAVQRPLYIAPDGDRIEWLKTWEAEQQKEG